MIEVNFYFNPQAAVITSRRWMWFQQIKVKYLKFWAVKMQDNCLSQVFIKNRLKMNLGKENYFAARIQKENVVVIVTFSSLFIRVN